MLGKFGILVTILVLVLLFFLVISLGAGAFSKDKLKPETKKYLKSPQWLRNLKFKKRPFWRIDKIRLNRIRCESMDFLIFD